MIVLGRAAIVTLAFFAASAAAACERYVNLSDGSVLTLGANESGEAPATLRKLDGERVVWTATGSLFCGRGDEPCELRLPTVKAIPDPEEETAVQVSVERFEDEGREYLVAVGLREYLLRVFDLENQEQLAVEPVQAAYGEGDTFPSSVFRCDAGS